MTRPPLPSSPPALTLPRLSANFSHVSLSVTRLKLRAADASGRGDSRTGCRGVTCRSPRRQSGVTFHSEGNAAAGGS
ncbi:hypothetical protein F2P81_015752 [Scophthalmus maximus]|uniref:Uncharacterized protein n=1 Tax=Scophthalmus maximus TaxID=52904 RepID=A0A6A4SD93_SCOMX|nr:hypothetical protein F2P81_015752 [Scophthalmus maximus]